MYEQIFRIEFKKYQTKPGCLVDFSPDSDIRKTISSMLTSTLKHDTKQPTFEKMAKARGKAPERERTLAMVSPSELEHADINTLKEFCLLHCVNNETGNEMVTLANFNFLTPNLTLGDPS